MLNKLEMFFNHRKEQEEVCIILKDGFKWDEIIVKYGVKIWNGNKIRGCLKSFDQKGVTISAEKIGMGLQSSKCVKVSFDDIDDIKGI